jgi:hypothetical protein
MTLGTTSGGRRVQRPRKKIAKVRLDLHLRTFPTEMILQKMLKRWFMIFATAMHPEVVAQVVEG